MSAKGNLISRPLSVAGFAVVRSASVEKLEARLNQEVANREETDEALTQLRQKLDELKRELEEKTHEIETHTRELAQAEMTIGGLRQTLRNRERQISFLERELRDAIQGELDRLFNTTSVGSLM